MAAELAAAADFEPHDPQQPQSAATPLPAKCLILGTHNRHKVAELSELLRPLGIPVRSLADFPRAVAVDECGQTFAANAALKAGAQARRLGEWVLADDAGLLVDALGGAPGIYSARYAGQGASAAQNRLRLLSDLRGVPLECRTARFVCHLALADPAGVVRAVACGACSGRILFEPAGGQEFGYDALFELPEYHRTFGQLGPAAKNVLSHRARAVRQLIPQIAGLMTPDRTPCAAAAGPHV